MNSKDLQELAKLRLKEAESLLQGNMPAGAYYLAGYAVECALKACIAQKTKEHDFPDKNLVARSYTHDLTRLLRLAGLEQKLKTSEQLGVNWSLVKDWNESKRYEFTDMTRAEQLHRAILDKKHGVFQWIQEHWQTKTSK